MKEKNIEKGKKGRGQKELKSYQEGKEITLKQRILAKCYECSGGYVDGRTDCKISGCPLYPIMPYSPIKLKQRKALSEEQKEAVGERLKKARQINKNI